MPKLYGWNYSTMWEEYLPNDLHQIRFYHCWFEICLGIFSYILNGALIYMAMYKSTRHMRAYRVIIIMNSCVDLVYNTINISCQVIVDMKDGALFFMSGYYLEKLPQPYACYLHNLWMFGLLISVLNIPIQFVFRYNILCKSRTLSTKELIATFCFPAALIALHCCYGVKAYMVTEEQRAALLPVLRGDPLWKVDTPVFSSGYVTTAPVQIDFAGTQGVVIISYAVIFYTGHKIHVKLQQSRAIMSKATLLAQSQLSKILLLESAIPFLVMGVPITFCIASVVGGFNIPLLGLLMATMASCIPLVNAICIICIVPSYRRFVLGVLMKRKISAEKGTTFQASSADVSNTEVTKVPKNSQRGDSEEKV